MVAPIDHSVSLWMDLMKLLLQGRHETRSMHEGDSPPSPRYYDCVAFARAREAQHIVRVECAIDQWLDTGRWPPLTIEEQYQTHLRFVAVLLFLTHVVIGLDGDNATTIIPFPSMNQSMVARWMLIDWWHDHGHELLCSLGALHYASTG